MNWFTRSSNFIQEYTLSRYKVVEPFVFSVQWKLIYETDVDLDFAMRYWNELGVQLPIGVTAVIASTQQTLTYCNPLINLRNW